MKDKTGKFEKLCNMYSQCTEKNKENLVQTAKNLLKIQRANAAMLAVPLCENEPACSTRGAVSAAQKLFL